MHVSLPPFAIAPATSRFPALSALAARSALGAGREVTLAILVAARLVDGVLSQALTVEARTARATAATQWLTAACPDARVRSACIAVVDATTGDARDPLAKALTKVVESNGSHLDGASKAELTALVRSVTGPA